MKLNTILKLEEVAQFALSLVLFDKLDLSWWWFAGLILTPDLGMLGYAINTKIGALLYNIFHHKGIAILIGFAGFAVNNQALMVAGVILYGHTSMDRIFGYGLKFNDSFHHTHLGWIKPKDD